MLTKKSIFFFFFVVCISVSSYSQEQGLNSIVQADLQRHLTFIASDSLQGRRFGTEVPGLKIAAEYIQQNIEKDGLNPGPNGYFQRVDIQSLKPDAENTFLNVNDETGKKIIQSKELISLTRGASSIDLSGELVFAGFGWQDTVSGYDDFRECDMHGKILLYAQGSPKTYVRGKSQPWNDRMEAAKIERVFKAGAKAVIIFTTPDNNKNQTFNQIQRWTNRSQFSLASAEKDVANEKFVFVTTPEVANKILDGKLRKMLAHLSHGEKWHDNIKGNYKVNVQIGRKTELLGGRNVLGIVEGSDPELKDECVVYMAHYDHLGIGKNGDVYNGADDNGSGTVALLELAQAFQALDEKPKRSILFLWVTGEEIGLFGSRYYVNHPIFPLNKTAACINIDMIGRVYEPRDSVWKNSPKKVKDKNGVYTLASNFCPQMLKISDSACKSLGLVPDKSLPERFIRSSDQYNFHKKGVPILNVATGYHADYHKVTDEVSRINFDKMKRVVDMCFLVGYQIANQQKRLEVVSAEK